MTRLATLCLLLAAGCAEGAPPPAEEAAEPAAEQPPATADTDLLRDPTDPAWDVTAPDVFRARFETTTGDFVVEVHRDWAPHGADRFYALVENGFFDDVRFFRVVPGFMVQFGMHGDPVVATRWKDSTIPDDPVVESNTRGMVTFAKTSAPNSRSTQIFINFVDNSGLDAQGFAPFGQVVEGMDVVDSIYDGYGESIPRGRGPQQSVIMQMGNEYLEENYPELDVIERATIVDE